MYISMLMQIYVVEFTPTTFAKCRQDTNNLGVTTVQVPLLVFQLNPYTFAC